MSRLHESIAVTALEVIAALFSVAVIEMMAGMAWCLFPDERPPFGPAGAIAVMVLRHKLGAQVIAVLLTMIRLGTFVRVRWAPGLHRWLVWGTWFVAHVLIVIAGFFATTYAVIAGTLPQQ